MREARQMIVSGRVQGVMFRHFTQKHARTLGLVGEVQNLPDGTVRVVAVGKPAALDQLIAKLNQGPTFARVDSVIETTVEPTGTFSEFSIVYD